ncbi:hypothetical protein [Neobacillus cucumis]|uniref:hypothetical protein n=1 Tax=Neobacillus cucumis TaxID=1740721 RepID=UPI00196389E2|nr:hypothetical protein [Neobacillus cucumis]MBM7651768.1 hypothetical protein [Neobacillus cucumis]
MSNNYNGSQLDLVIEHLETEYKHWRRTLNWHRIWLEMYENSNSDYVEVIKESVQKLMDESDYAYGCLKASEILR